ncbi:MAG: hypothetical protein ACXVEJ_15370 [Nocardioides sp.]
MLVALVVTAGLAIHLRRTGAVLVALVSITWLLVNKSMEGDTLLHVTRSHGLTAGDLAGLAGLGLALIAWLLADE